MKTYSMMINDIYEDENEAIEAFKDYVNSGLLINKGKDRMFTILDMEKTNSDYNECCAHSTDDFRYKVVFTQDLNEAIYDFNEGDEDCIWYQSVFFNNDLSIIKRELKALEELHCEFSEEDSMLFVLKVDNNDIADRYSIIVSDKFEILDTDFYCELKKRYIYKTVASSYCLSDIMDKYKELAL